MSRRLAFLTVLVLLAFTTLSPAQEAATAAADLPSAADIVARNVQARGGLERLLAVRAIRMAGTMTGPTGEEVPTAIYMERPNKIRQEIEVGGRTLVQAFDGTRGWHLNPATGEPVEVPSSIARRMHDQADFDGPLVDAESKGHRVDVLGRDTVDGTPVVKLRLTKRSGEVQVLYLDAERGLELKSEATIDQGGRRVRIESRNSDFRTVDGITTPFAVDVFADGTRQQRIVLEKVEFSADLDDTLFQKPVR